VNVRASTIWLLGGLAGAIGLWLYSRTRAGSALADQTIELVDVSASRVGAALSSRGYRNNNPGNVRFIVRNPWNGQVGDDAGYGIYDTAQNGTRALGRELLKRETQGFRTVRDVIAGKPQANGQRAGGWAPPNENDTDSYVRDVAAQLGVDADEPLDISYLLAPFARAIARHENGYVDSAYNFDTWVRL
jgi:hypothetical protein